MLTVLHQHVSLPAHVEQMNDLADREGAVSQSFAGSIQISHCLMVIVKKI